MTMKTETNNRLFTSELEESLKDYPLYSQDNLKCNAVCVLLFRLGKVRWYILEGEKRNDDITLYGIVVGLCETEYGYISLNDLSQVSLDASKYGLGTLYVEQDTNFKQSEIGKIEDDELQSFLSNLY